MGAKNTPRIGTEYITKEDAAAYLGVGDTFFRDSVRPYIPNYKFGALVRFKIKDLERWAESKAEKYQVG